MTVTVANLPYSFCPASSAASVQGFMFKNAYDAWFYNNSTATATQITDIDYPGYHTYTVTTLTSVGTTATVYIAGGHGLSVGDNATMAGAAQTEYNIAHTVATVPDSTHYTYTFAGSATTPATGTITTTGGAVTVPGIVSLDQYFIVMDTKGIVYNSGLADAPSWNALDFVTAQIEPGGGVALDKSQNYVLAFKEWSTEFFYDAANPPPGTPLSPVGVGFNLIGCAAGGSVANLDGTVFWVSQTRQKGRGVHMMTGLDAAQVSTPDVERILNLSTLATVHSFGVKIAGHAFYVLTLVDRDITLVFDATTKVWTVWSSLTLGTPVSVTSIVLVGTTATVTTGAAHNLTDGDPVLIAGANQAAYNGIKVITYVDATHYTFETTAGTTTPATGTITSTPYTESYFKYTKYIHALGRDLLQHESDGTLCELTESAYQDVGKPVNVLIRTGKIDGQNGELKSFPSLELIGNKVVANAYIRWSDDDYQTNSRYRLADLSATNPRQRAIIWRCGSAMRRSIEIRHLDNTSLHLASIDVNAV